MCGLVGIAGQMTGRDDITIKRLLMYDFFRGPDSTGLASIRGNGDVRIAKLAMDPVTLFHYDKFKHAQEGISRVYMGHNRAATRGATNNLNAHPYQYDHIVGAHNGTLDFQSWKRLEEAIGEKVDVDSKAMIMAIAKIGIQETISLCETGKDAHTGAWSLTWYDLNDGTLNFLRNEHRPMWLAHSKDFKRLLWASEFWMLDAAGHADGFEYVAKDTKTVKGARFFPTEVDTHYKFDVGLFITATEQIKPKTKIIKGREPLPVVSHTYSDDPFGRSGTCGFHLGSHEIHTRESKESKTKSSSTISYLGKTPRSNPDNVLHWWGTPKHPYAGLIDEEKFNILAKYGCSWCSGDVTFGDPGVTIFERDSMLLCQKCSGLDNVKDEDVHNRIYVSKDNFVKLRT